MELSVAPGTLLAAWPDLRDPNFMHSVVLMCQHGESGAYGLVVNRPTELTVADLFPEHALLGELAFPVHLGGPVDHETLQFVHRVPDEIPGGLELGDGVFLGGEFDALTRVLGANAEPSATDPLPVRLLLGYSGWGAGQLEGELAGGSWVPAPLSVEAVFGDDTQAVWRAVVRSTGPEGHRLESQPPDPSWN